LRETDIMITQPYRLYVERRDIGQNMAWFYAMSIEADLFGRVCLRRIWGRIGSNGQTIVQHFVCEEDAVQLFLQLLRRKRQRGYRPGGGQDTRARHKN
jgi:predicted DNA-binding WGR domain protein